MKIEPRLGVARSVLGVALVVCACDSRSLRDPARKESMGAENASVLVAPEAAPPFPYRLTGRFDVSDPNGIRFAWPGSAIAFRVEGATEVHARLADEGSQFYEVDVDGAHAITFRSSPKVAEYTLAKGLNPQAHEISLIKLTEARVGEASLRAVDPINGRFDDPPASRVRKIEILGDSISTGYGDTGTGPICNTSPASQDEEQSYGAITARALSADHVTIAWSAKTIGEMTELWERTLPARQDSHWSFSWVPNVVLVNLGTNDFAIVDPGEKRFVEKYTTLLQHIRAKYPASWIFCILGPILSDAYPPNEMHLTLARKYMQTATNNFRMHDNRVEMVDVGPQDPFDGMGCGSHPNVKTHQRMADKLVPIIKERLGW